MSYFSKNSYVSKGGPSSMMGKTFLTGGLIALLFGIAILIQPDLIAYLVATFFIVIGLSLLGTWWRLRR
jgi:uncharacterized membrane protein HdeD (DUF308 family)